MLPGSILDDADVEADESTPIFTAAESRTSTKEKQTRKFEKNIQKLNQTTHNIKRIFILQVSTNKTQRNRKDKQKLLQNGMISKKKPKYTNINTILMDRSHPSSLVSIANLQLYTQKNLWWGRHGDNLDIWRVV